MKQRTFLLLSGLFCLFLVAGRLALTGRPMLAVPTNSDAVHAVNALGIDLLRQTGHPGANVLLSPYSIQMALAMTCAGANGRTRDEMVRVLHYPKDEDRLNRSFADLQASVDGIMSRDSATAQHNFERYKEYLNNNAMPGAAGGEYKSAQLAYLNSLTNSVLTLTTVNRLYGQSGHDVRPAYLKLLKDNWQASFESVDFIHHASGITAQINSWVQDQTHGRIRNLLPAHTLDGLSRLVLVNAVYLKAPWLHTFSVGLTQPAPFHLADGTVIQVPTMSQPHEESFLMGYAKRASHWGFPGSGCTILSLPYNCEELQFVILMPDRCNGLPALEASLTPEILAGCTNLPGREVDLSLPKFKAEPPDLSLVEALRALGMKNAFEQDADFSRSVLPGSEPGLYLTGVFHKTFLQLDETGTEASAGTGTVRSTYGSDTHTPVQVRIDRPFLFMIQHRTTGACLFLGHITDPR